MIITRTPYRISFFGGGTDYPAWYKDNGGSVLSTTINKYCHISCRYLPPFFPYDFLIRYSQREEVKKIEEINHPSVRECLRYLNVDKGLEVVHTGDIPARSGVGSSSSFTVGLLHAINALKGKMITKRQLVRDAIHIEQNMIRENVGSQDQVAVAFGGLNRIDFGGDNEFFVSPVTINKEKYESLQSHLMLFFTGIARFSSDIAGEQIKQTPKNGKELTLMRQMVDEAMNILNSDSENIESFGKLLHEAWLLKRGLTKLISTDKIDQIYDTALREGALGGKLLGAGGGGFILFFVPPYKQQNLKNKLKDFLHVPFSFECLGSQVVMYSTQEVY